MIFIMDSADPLILVLSTFPDMNKARQIGTALIERQLVACVNFVPGILSVYRWENEIQQDDEVLGVFKTRRALFLKVEATLTELHPYQTPEIVSLDVAQASKAYGSWIAQVTGEDVPG